MTNATDNKTEEPESSKYIQIKYSEDFRGGKIVGEVYGTLRDNGLTPVVVTTAYFTEAGIGMATYNFKWNSSLPSKQELEKMLEEFNLEIERISN